ncbi:hypothetical protein SH2C18_34510 [Clostridium sediminicola]|uniref:hypothetical protein n=1 Tax=Clostridium sediminicola TaxID=3114879 RepID=UPI0031F2205C
MVRKGFNKGEYETAVEKVRACLQQGLSVRQIVEETNLSQEQISEIRNRMQTKQDQEWNDTII